MTQTDPEPQTLTGDRTPPPEKPNYDGTFDAIVVGAGLAGSAAAIRISRRDLDVLVIEKGAYPGAKNVFGGVLYTPTVRELVDIEDAPTERFVSERRFSMLTDDDEIAASVRPGKWRDPPHNDSFTVFRGEFDEWFAERAVEAGATLLTETTVTDLVRDDGRIVGVETDRPDGTIRAPVVVLAEGGNSLVAEGADLKAKDERADVAIGVKEVLEFPDGDDVVEERFRLSGDGGASYHYFGEGAVGDAFGGGFIYTNSDTVSVGLAYRIEDAVDSQPDPEATLNAFKSHPAVAPLVRGARTVEYAAKAIPEGGASKVPSLVHDGALLVGDTAGLVLNNGIHLEGTNMAVESGYHAGNAVVTAIRNSHDSAVADSGRGVDVRADGGGVVSASDLEAYPEALADSFVVQNLEHYEWLINTVLEDRQLLFEALPEALADAAAEYFRIDRTPKSVHAENAKERVLGTLGGWPGAMKLGWRYRNLFR